MKILITFILFNSPFSFGQLKNLCFDHSNPYSYGVYDKISFSDSTFKYEFIQGLINGTVNGSFQFSNDTLILNSEYKSNDYQIIKSYDSLIQSSFIQLQIKQLDYNNVIEVRSNVDDSNSIIEEKIIKKNNAKILVDFPDTVIQLYEIPILSSKNQEISVQIWRKNTTISIPITTKFNSYLIDLTTYPNELDYRFFDRQHAVIQEGCLYFLDENNKPEKDYYPIQTRKGITMSKKKKIKKYLKCQSND